MVISLDNEVLVAWFLESFPSAPYAGDSVCTIGSDPFPEDDFDNLLDEADVNYAHIDDAHEILIIGRTDWDRESLNDLLDKREGKRLKVYSQEMFLAYWVSGRDPFENEDVARAFGEGHPALEYLSTRWIVWPSTFVQLGSGGFLLDSPPIGIFRTMGHRVGRRGKIAIRRRQILSRMFDSVLPNIGSPKYMNQWGAPKSKERLEKMANTLSSFCQREKRKNNFLAASHYEDDLKWLYDNYYTGRFRFQWPSTSVG